MVLHSKEASDIDVQSLTEVLARKGFQPTEIRAHLESFKLPVPDLTKVAAFQMTAQAAEKEIEPAIREAAQRLGKNPSVDEESWLLMEAARSIGDELISDTILEAGTSPAPDTPPKGINPKAMGVWKKLFKEHGKEITDAKPAKQWGVAVAIFKNLAKADGYEPFVEKAAWTLDSMSLEEKAQTISTLTALAENLEMLGLEDLASDVDAVTASFEENMTSEERRLAMATENVRISSMLRDVQVMPFENFAMIVAQSLDSIKSRDFTRLFKKASKLLREGGNGYLHGVKQVYSLFADVFTEDKKLFSQAPPEALEAELFPVSLGYVHDAIMAMVDSVGGDDFYEPEENIPPINRRKLKNYLQSPYVEGEIHKVLSRSPLWRQQFGL